MSLGGSWGVRGHRGGRCRHRERRAAEDSGPGCPMATTELALGAPRPIELAFGAPRLEIRRPERPTAIRFVDGLVAPPSNGFALPDTRSAELFRDRWVCGIIRERARRTRLGSA